MISDRELIRMRVKIEQDPRWIVLRVWNQVLVSASKVR